MKTSINKIFLLAAVAGTLTLSSCSLFKKGCDCPKFGEKAPATQHVKMASANTPIIIN